MNSSARQAKWTALPWFAFLGVLFLVGCANAPDGESSGTPHYSGEFEATPGGNPGTEPPPAAGQTAPPPTAPPPTALPPTGAPPTGAPPTGAPPTGPASPPMPSSPPPEASSGAVRSVSGRVVCDSCDGEVLLYAFNTPDQIPRSNNTIKIEVLTPPWEFTILNIPVEYPVYLQARWDPNGKIHRGPPIDGTRVTAYANNPVFAGSEAVTGIEIDLESGPLLNMGPGGPPGS